MAIEIKSFQESNGWMEVTWVDGDVQVWCQSFHPTQNDLLRAKADEYGTSLEEYDAQLTEWVNSYTPPEPEVVSLEERIKQFELALDTHMDNVARERRYDNRITCALRAGFPGPFQSEGIAFATWMDECNAMAYQLLNDVTNGQREMPNDVQVFIDLLPKIEWPVNQS